MIAVYLEKISDSMQVMGPHLAGHFINRASAISFDRAEALYQKNQESFDDNKKISLLTTMAKNALNTKNHAGFNRTYAALSGLQSAKDDEASVKRFQNTKINHLCSVFELL